MNRCVPTYLHRYIGVSHIGTCIPKSTPVPAPLLPLAIHGLVPRFDIGEGLKQRFGEDLLRRVGRGRAGRVWGFGMWGFGDAVRWRHHTRHPGARGAARRGSGRKVGRQGQGGSAPTAGLGQRVGMGVGCIQTSLHVRPGTYPTRPCCAPAFVPGSFLLHRHACGHCPQISFPRFQCYTHLPTRHLTAAAPACLPCTHALLCCCRPG